MSSAISGLLGAIVGGLAAIAAGGIASLSADRRWREEAARQDKLRREDAERQDTLRREDAERQDTLRREDAERQDTLRRAESAALLQERRRLLARRYLYQMGDAIDSFLHRVDNWARRGGPTFSEERHPGYWEVTSLYVVARALGTERVLALEGVYVELQALASNEGERLPPRAVEEAVREAFKDKLFYYHRLNLAEAVLDRHRDEFRILTYSEFLRLYESPEQNFNSLLEPARQAFDSLNKEKLENLEQSLKSLRERIEKLTTSHNTNGVNSVEAL